jgi:carbohydrate-binding DOMON domain-containing protein
MEVTCPRCKGVGRPVEVDTSRYCIPCRRENSRKVSAKRKRERPFYVYAQHKNSWNRRNGFSPELTEDYLKSIWTGYCPISKKPIRINGKREDPYRAHLDRINPNFGYVVDNVVWLSARMNRLKNNATIDELKELLNWMSHL